MKLAFVTSLLLLVVSDQANAQGSKGVANDQRLRELAKGGNCRNAPGQNKAPEPAPAPAPETAPAPAPETPASPAVGSCMGDDSVGVVSGMNTADGMVCTAGDVSVASLVVIGGSPTECTPGSSISVSFEANLQSTSNSRRSDIGVWIANDAESNSMTTGSCSHFYFPAGDTPSLGQLPDLGGNGEGTCGDIGDQEAFTLPFAYPQDTMDIPCVDTDGDGFVDVDYSISWKVPGKETDCPMGGTTELDFRKGTVPGTKSKCKGGRANTNICLDPALCGTVEPTDPVIDPENEASNRNGDPPQELTTATATVTSLCSM